MFETFEASESEIISLNYKLDDHQMKLFLEEHARNIIIQPPLSELDPNLIILRFSNTLII